MTQKESEYRATLKWAEKEYGLTEEEFLYLYHLNDDEEKEKEYAKFPPKMRYGIVHLQAAYCGYLREKEKQEEEEEEEKKSND
jgi:hypothetical protein